MKNPMTWLEVTIAAARQIAAEMLDALGVKVVYVAPEYRHMAIVCTQWIERERAQA